MSWITRITIYNLIATFVFAILFNCNCMDIGDLPLSTITAAQFFTISPILVILEFLVLKRHKKLPNSKALINSILTCANCVLIIMWFSSSCRASLSCLWKQCNFVYAKITPLIGLVVTLVLFGIHFICCLEIFDFSKKDTAKFSLKISSLMGVCFILAGLLRALLASHSHELNIWLLRYGVLSFII